MLDNFRKRDVSPSARPQSPYSRMQEALTSAGTDTVKPDTPFKAEAPKPVPREEIKPPRPDDESGSKLIVGPDIKLRGAEPTDFVTLTSPGCVDTSMRVHDVAI